MNTRSIVATLWLFAVLPCAPVVAQVTGTPASPAVETHRIDVGGHALRMIVSGDEAAPTVVFDAGLGDGLDGYSNILPEVAGFARVVAYDRAGYGESERGAEPRSFSRAAAELHALLQGAGIAPPYVLVGHSLGGANIRAFAHLYKDDVAGMVFIDPISETEFASLEPEELEKIAAEQQARLEGGPPGAIAEFAYTVAQARSGFPELAGFGPLPDVPMTLLVAGRGPADKKKALLLQYGGWMADATEGGILLAPDSAHYIHRDDPALVVAAIRDVAFPSVRIALERAIRTQGPDAAIALYRQLRTRHPADAFEERTLNLLGYDQLRAGNADAAVALFALNVEMYPQSANVYDSLGEGYMARGNRDAAIENYRRSLSLNPDNGNAARMLEKLR